MITPRFFVQQDEEFIHINIFIKYAKITNIEIEITENTFWFYLKPYHLKLSLPGQIKSDSKEKLVYDIESGKMIISVVKLNKGEFFADLDLITKLLQPKQKGFGGVLIEPVNSEIQEDNVLAVGYGFNRKEKGLFTSRQEEAIELFDIDPENCDHEYKLLCSASEEDKD